MKLKLNVQIVESQLLFHLNQLQVNPFTAENV